ncbi:MAG TPA: bifunctional (p)ppGpp synthetase/guanosine-3',5'-bis(diphosphate) 3'-pyrophosphohydrolase [Dehalococcoidia bacterium]|nr:bifunctional (p)ppGpp synthetase/guanosine-3',5'-bis(diphosphate) 3'-pyrophosphohydrolase [Dehalococcoidia bacterium]
MNVSELLDRVAEYLPEDKVSVVADAYAFAETAHEGALRLSGEPYIQHPLQAAYTVADLQLDASAVAAALMHDTMEDCGVTPAQLEKRFGPEIARLVEGTTKLSKMHWQPPEGRPADGSQAENLRKMFLAMAEDVRVVIIKLADRLHNMRTLDAKEPEKRRRIAAETMEIYAPLANRLGIWQIKWELEDLSFRYLNPEKYREIAQLVQSKRAMREQYIRQVERILTEELEKHGVEAEVKGRAKHIYSIYQKIARYEAQGKSFNEIYDLLALRVLVNSGADCYNALGIVHNLWRPIPGQFDDYIASPKDSLYQSLHTTVMCLGARPLEVQIRTQEMHQIAEYGVAAHWRYKEGGKRDLRFEERLAWLRQLLDWQRELKTADDFVDSVKTDIFGDQVFVYTPKGEIKDLPAGSTPLDFAYRIHTDLGHNCVGTKVNGRLLPLNHALQNGDVVEIMSSKSSRGPSRDWLNADLGYLKTNHAKEKVRAWFKKRERVENIERGRELLEKELRRLGVSLAEKQGELLKLCHLDSTDDLFQKVGCGDLSLHQITARLAAAMEARQEPILPPAVASPRRVVPSNIRVLGQDDLLTSIARCCTPVPGDEIVGYITRSRGVTIHRADCPNIAAGGEDERIVPVQWGGAEEFYPVALHIVSMDRVGLLRDITTLISDEKVNMNGVRTQRRNDHETSIQLTVEIKGIEQLSRLLNKLEGVRGVISVGRAREGVRAEV